MAEKSDPEERDVLRAEIHRLNERLRALRAELDQILIETQADLARARRRLEEL